MVDLGFETARHFPRQEIIFSSYLVAAGESVRRERLLLAS